MWRSDISSNLTRFASEPPWASSAAFGSIGVCQASCRLGHAAVKALRMAGQCAIDLMKCRWGFAETGESASIMRLVGGLSRRTVAIDSALILREVAGYFHFGGLASFSRRRMYRPNFPLGFGS